MRPTQGEKKLGFSPKQGFFGYYNHKELYPKWVEILSEFVLFFRWKYYCIWCESQVTHKPKRIL